MADDPCGQYATSDKLATRGSLHAKYAQTDWFAWLRERMTLPPGSQVLDVGCGPGWFWRAQAQHLPDGLRLALIDRSPGMIEEARVGIAATGRFGAIRTRVADAAMLPFDDACFDAVVAAHVLYHVEEPVRALREMARVLRPGGRAFVTTNTVDSMAELSELGARVLGTPAADRGAARFSLDDAVRLMGGLFTDVRRHDLADRCACIDPADAVAYLLSMPPGDDATVEQRRRLEDIVQRETERGGGVLRITKRTGMVEGMKQATAWERGA